MQTTVKVHGLSLLPDVDGLHGPAVPVSSGSGLDLRSLPVNRLLGRLCVYCYPVLGIPCLHRILVFRYSLLHGPSHFSNVCELAVTAGHFIDNISFSIWVLCFTCITMLLNVFWGLKMVFTPKGAHTFSSFLLTPLTYGRNIGLAVSSSASFSLDLGAEEKVLLTVLTGYPLAMTTFSKWCNLACLLVSSQIWWAQWRMHCITPVSILG